MSVEKEIEEARLNGDALFSCVCLQFVYREPSACGLEAGGTAEVSAVYEVIVERGIVVGSYICMR